MSILDSIVTVGKKILPPPAILLFSHIVFGVFGTIMLCLNLMSSSSTLWSAYVTLFVGGIPLCVGMSFIKYKQTDSIIASLISGFVFFCTIVAIQYWPWSTWTGNNTSASMIFNFVRLLCLTPLTVTYGLWCKKEIEKFLHGLEMSKKRVNLETEINLETDFSSEGDQFVNNPETRA